MTADVVKANGGWVIKSSDAGSSGYLTRGSSAGISVPTASDARDFVIAIDRAAAGSPHTFTRSDGASIKAYRSDRKKGSIVLERSAGNWIRLTEIDVRDLRLKLNRL